MNLSDLKGPLPKLNLPDFHFDMRNGEDGTDIFDYIRKKWVRLLPEEWTRQNLLRMLTDHLQYPGSRIKLEQKIEYTGIYKMADILVYDKRLSPYLLMECKAPDVKLSQDVLDQLGMYNSKLKAKYIGISNGLVHYFFRYDGLSKYEIIRNFPEYE